MKAQNTINQSINIEFKKLTIFYTHKFKIELNLNIFKNSINFKNQLEVKKYFTRKSSRTISFKKFNP